jgi:uncharacterized protein YjbI with pentapeptide repeats
MPPIPSFLRLDERLRWLKSPKIIINALACGIAYLFVKYRLIELQRVSSWIVDSFRGKTFWEVLEVVLIPILVAFMVWFLQRREDQQRAENRMAANKEEALQAYFDRILAVDPSLDWAMQRSAIKARTISILKYFANDPLKKDAVISFLADLELLGTDFLKCTDLSKANLSGFMLAKASLEGVDLSHANLERAILNGAVFYRFGGAISTLKEARLVWAEMINTNLERCILEGSDLSMATLDYAIMEYAVLKRANLSGANLFGARLRNADLRNADLRDSLLRDADLRKANLEGAILCGANRSWSNLKAVNFRMSELCRIGAADLEGANLQGVRWNRNTRWPPREVLSKARNLPVELKKLFDL